MIVHFLFFENNISFPILYYLLLILALSAKVALDSMTTPTPMLNKDSSILMIRAWLFIPRITQFLWATDHEIQKHFW